MDIHMTFQGVDTSLFTSRDQVGHLRFSRFNDQSTFANIVVKLGGW